MLGITDLIRRMFPPFPIGNFAPNFTGFDLNQNISWYEFQKSLGQQIESAITMVCNFVIHVKTSAGCIM